MVIEEYEIFGGTEMFKSLRAKITLTMICMVTICTAIFTSISYYELKSSVEKQMKNGGRTLITTIRREIGKYKITNLKEIQILFQDVKKESEGNIAYISLSNNQSKILVSDSSILETHKENSVNGSSTNNEVDAVTSASKSEDVSEVVKDNKIDGEIIKTSEGLDVYNISAPLYTETGIVGVLNIGISLSDMNSQIANTLIVILACALIIELLTVLLASVISGTLTKPIQKIVSQLDSFSKGDFTILFHCKSKDEIRNLTNSLNSSVEILKNTISTVKSAVEKLYGIASHLALAGQEVSASSEEISQNIAVVTDDIKEEENNISFIVQRFEQFGCKVDEVICQANDVFARNNNIKESAILGVGKLDDLVASIDDVRTSFNSATQDILALNSDVGQINQIIEDINGIAEQTNLLALNAAIESARAGESGKGFAVVSEEIRKLAEKVMKSSKNINQIIGGITENAQTVVNDTAAISRKMDLQKTTIEETVNSLDIIKNEVDKTLANMDSVMASLETLSEDKEQIFKNVGAISDISIQVSCSAEEISASIQNQSSNIEELSMMANELNELADKLKKNVDIFKT